MYRTVRTAPILGALGVVLAAASLGLAAGPAAAQHPDGSLTLERYREGWRVLDRAARALGGWGSVEALDGVTVWMHGTEAQRFQGPSPEPPFRELDVEMTLVLDFTGSRLGSELVVQWPDFTQHVRRVAGVSWGRIEFPRQGTARVDSTLQRADLDYLARRVPHHLLRTARSRPSTVRYLGRRVRNARTEEVVTLLGADDDLLSVHVDSATGRITGHDRLVLDWRRGDAAYRMRYLDWTTEGELPHPGTIRISRAGVLVAEATVDSVHPGVAGMTGSFARFDSVAAISGTGSGADPLPPVTTLAPGVHLVERIAGRNYNMLFVEVGDGLLAVDAPLDERATDRAVRAVRAAVGDRPLRFAVPTHHHGDHAGGIRALVEEGASVLTTRGNVELFADVATAVRSLVAEPRPSLEEAGIEAIEGSRHVLEMGDRIVHVYDVGPNAHVNEHLVVYLPRERLLFQGDLVQFRRDGGVEPARPHTASLLRLIEGEDLEVDVIAGTHGRPGTVEELRAAIAARETGTSARSTEVVSPPPTRFPAHRVEQPVAVDGALDESLWQDAQVIGLPYEWSPGDNVRAPVRTECRLAYDRSHLYVGCLARDPRPEAIRAHLAERDSPFEDDHLVFFFDTFSDGRRGFQFRVNPLGVQMDALFGNSFEDFSWDAIWDSEGRITAEGYEVEVAIPFESLDFPQGSGEQSWGVILERSYPRSVRHRMRNVPTDRSDACVLCQAATLTGLRGIEVGSDLELHPTVTATRSDARVAFQADGLEHGPVEMDPGLNLRWGVTTNQTVAATVNPDFSQVEADAAQLETNRRFALFFPEKRPFFLEGADLFETRSRLVHTRTVVDPVAGTKFIGKTGGHAVGAFVTVDAVNALLFPASQFSRRTLLDDPGDETEVLTVAGRYRRDVGRSSTLGALVTSREGSGYHNRLGALDADLQLSRSWSLDLQYARSETLYPDSVASAFGQPTDGFGGNNLEVGLNHFSRDWLLFGSAFSRDATFRSDVGFVSRVGDRGGRVFGEKVFWGGSDRWFSRIGLGGRVSYTGDPAGRVLGRSVSLETSYEGPLQSTVDLSVEWEEEAFGSELFSLASRSVFLRLQPSGSLSFGTSARFGDQIDFDNARKAEVVSLRPGMMWKAGRRLNLDLSHAFERLSLDGRRIFTAHLPQARLVYHLSLEAFVRAIVQYRHVIRDPAMYATPVERTSEDLFTQLLFSYEVNPRTVAFAGYSDRHVGFTGRPASTSDGTASADLTQTGRTFFVKLGYAWRP